MPRSNVTHLVAYNTDKFCLIIQLCKYTTCKIYKTSGNCEGIYNGPMFPKPIQAQCVLLITAGYVQETNRRYIVTSSCGAFIHLDHAGAAGWMAQHGAPVYVRKEIVHNAYVVQTLKDRGAVAQTDLGKSGVVYQVIGCELHHHLVCLRCGRVIDIEDQVMDALREQLRREHAFEPRIDHMAIFGLCHDCRAGRE